MVQKMVTKTAEIVMQMLIMLIAYCSPVSFTCDFPFQDPHAIQTSRG